MRTGASGLHIALLSSIALIAIPCGLEREGGEVYVDQISLGEQG